VSVLKRSVATCTASRSGCARNSRTSCSLNCLQLFVFVPPAQAFPLSISVSLRPRGELLHAPFTHTYGGRQCALSLMLLFGNSDEL